MKLFNKEQLLLYLVTDRGYLGKQSLYEQVELALKGGVTCVQLREKDMNEEDFIEEAIKIKALCHSYGVPLLINDNLEVARKSGADGIHVGQEDMPVRKIRELVGKNFIIGATAKTIDQAKTAEAEGADYLGVGAVFPSPTKKNALRITNEQFTMIVEAVDIPVVAIGGITRDKLSQLKGNGMSGIAVISGILAAEDICGEASALKEMVKGMVK